jgi:hypothetical protein
MMITSEGIIMPDLRRRTILVLQLLPCRWYALSCDAHLPRTANCISLVRAEKRWWSMLGKQVPAPEVMARVGGEVFLFIVLHLFKLHPHKHKQKHLITAISAT